MSEMYGSKSKGGSQLSPEFETNPYEKLNDLFFNPELEFIISVEDNYLKQAMVSYLNDINLVQKSADLENHEYMFISLSLGTFNFIEKPNFDGKILHELPYDWNNLIETINDYVTENPFSKPEVIEKDGEFWNKPRNEAKKDDSFLDRIKDKLGKK